jgi:hypothetical protein
MTKITGAFWDHLDIKPLCANTTAGCLDPGPYDPTAARPAVRDWQDPYNSGANKR